MKDNDFQYLKDKIKELQKQLEYLEQRMDNYELFKK